MSENRNLIIAVIALVVIGALLNLYVITNQSISVEAPEITIPESVTAAEVSAIVSSAVSDINTNVSIEIPDQTPMDVDSEMLYDIYKGTYEDEIEFVEDEALTEAEAEIDCDDIEELLEAEIADFDKMTSCTVSEDSVKVTSLGLDEDDDSIASVAFEVKVKYTLLSGLVGKYKETVYVNGTVVLEETDFGPETYEDVDVELAYSL